MNRDSSNIFTFLNNVNLLKKIAVTSIDITPARKIKTKRTYKKN